MEIAKLIAEIVDARARADALPEGPAYDAAMDIEGGLLRRLAERQPRNAVELSAKARAALNFGPDDALNAAVIRDAAAAA